MKRVLNNETTKYLGTTIKACGWVHSIRSHGKIIFIDLRDKGGLLQLVCTPKNKEVYKTAQELRPEWVICVEGKVGERPKNMINKDELCFKHNFGADEDIFNIVVELMNDIQTCFSMGYIL